MKRRQRKKLCVGEYTRYEVRVTGTHTLANDDLFFDGVVAHLIPRALYPGGQFGCSSFDFAVVRHVHKRRRPRSPKWIADLGSLTEADRECVIEFMKAQPYVTSFEVGPLQDALRWRSR